MNIPQTPLSTLNEMLDQKHGALWEHAWQRFYEIYFKVIECMARNTFAKINWSTLRPEDLESVISDSLESIIKDFNEKKYTQKGHRFRGYLKTVVTRRVIDFVRKNNKKKLIPAKVLDLIYDDQIQDVDARHPWEILSEEEQKLYSQRLFWDAWENAKRSLSPQVCIIFELVKLEERDAKSVMQELHIDRACLDRAVFKAMKKLRELLGSEDYRKELE